MRRALPGLSSSCSIPLPERGWPGREPGLGDEGQTSACAVLTGVLRGVRGDTKVTVCVRGLTASPGEKIGSTMVEVTARHLSSLSLIVTSFCPFTSSFFLTQNVVYFV